MNRGIYVTGAELHSGKSVVVLGMMELLSGVMGRVGFFCPIVADAREPDAFTGLIMQRYRIDVPYERLYGCTRDAASDMLLQGREEGLLKIILEKYRDIEKEFDLILCAGSEYSGPTAPLEFDFNAAAANNLGCAVLPVFSGCERDMPQILGAAQGLMESLRERKCDILALVANRVSPRIVDAVAAELKRVMPGGVPGYVIPELAILGYPTVGEIAAALGVVEDRVDAGAITARISTARSTRVTPLMFEHDIIQRAKSGRRHIVLPEGMEDRILRAAEILRMREVVEITLLGDPDEVRRKAAALGLALRGVAVINPMNSPRRRSYADAYFELRSHKGISLQMAYDAMADVSYFGTMMVHFGEADGMVSGSVHTTQHTIRPALEIIRTRPGCSIVSSVFLMCLSDRVLVFGDCAVNPDPDPEQLADIAVSSAETARMFGIDPLVAMLSYSTGESGKGSDVDKVREAAKIAKGRSPGLKIEGPIQYDAAVDAGVARTKLPGSEVAGRATVFIFPDLNTGNTTYKAVQRSANAVAVGPILQGLNKPVNDLSRGCTVTDIVNTVAITAIQAQSAGGPA